MPGAKKRRDGALQEPSCFIVQKHAFLGRKFRISNANQRGRVGVKLAHSMVQVSDKAALTL